MFWFYDKAAAKQFVAAFRLAVAGACNCQEEIAQAEKVDGSRPAAENYPVISGIEDSARAPALTILHLDLASRHVFATLGGLG